MSMRALVAGSANLDILAHPSSDSEHKDRIGEVTIEVGGTACNVAFCLKSAGLDVRLLTAWSDAPMTRLMEKHISSAGIELMADVVSGMPLAAFVAQLTVSGEMQSAVSSTPVETHQFDARRIDQSLEGVDCVVLDANLSAKTIKSIACQSHSHGIPVFAMRVSEDKVDRILAAANFLKAAFVNHIECEKLMLTIGAADQTEVAELIGAPLAVTRGDRGAMVYLLNGERIRILPPKLQGIKNLMGMGDAFSAGVIDGMIRYDLGFAAAANYAHGFVEEIAKSHVCNGYSMNAINNLVGDLYAHSRYDNLTGLCMRRFFEEEYPRYSNAENAVIVIDCDHFKKVNDTIGHEAGDQVLRTVASIVKKNVRAADIACRWGGDEFVALLPRTGVDEAKIVAERIRSKTQSEDLNGVTLSIGIAIAHPGDNLKDVFMRADSAMYAAKLSGKNAVVLA